MGNTIKKGNLDSYNMTLNFYNKLGEGSYAEVYYITSKD